MESKTPYAVMVSSTFRELAEHRGAIRDAMLGQRMLPVAMEDDAALPDQDLINASLGKVDEADAYVGLIGHRYGQTPVCPARNPDQLSLTELEFRRAVARGIPICMFLMHDDHPIPKRWVREERDTGQKLESFVRLVKHDRIYSEFDSVADLRAKAIQSLVRLREVLDARRAASAPPPATPVVPAATERRPINENETSKSETISRLPAEPPEAKSGPGRAGHALFAIACLVLSGICAWVVSLIGGEPGVSWIVLSLFSLGFVFFAGVGVLTLRRGVRQGG